MAALSPLGQRGDRGGHPFDRLVGQTRGDVDDMAAPCLSIGATARCEMKKNPFRFTDSKLMKSASE